MSACWPAFVEADAVAAAHLPRVRELFGGLEVALVDGDTGDRRCRRPWRSTARRSR